MRNCSPRIRTSPSIRVMMFHDFRYVPRSSFIKCSLHVQACLKHGWPSNTAMFQQTSSFFLPFPVFLSHICRNHLQIVATHPMYSSHVSFFQLSGSLSCSRRRILHDANHFDISDDSAMTLLLLIPFFGSASTDFHLGHDALLKTLRVYVNLFMLTPLHLQAR